MSDSHTKVLLYDIETAPNLAYVWGTFQQDVVDFETEWYMLSWSAKWLNGKQVTKGLDDYPRYKPGSEDDRQLTKDLYDLMQEADMLIAHNGDRFDLRRVNTRFLLHGFDPLPPIRTVDTLKLARKYFAFNKNRLDYLGQQLNVGRKTKHPGFEMWRGCLQGDRKYWKLMKKYNAQDVRLLEKVYLKLRAWHPTHPGIIFDDNRCKLCGSDDIHYRGYSYTRTGRRRRFKCQKCGQWSAGKHEKLVDVR